MVLPAVQQISASQTIGQSNIQPQQNKNRHKKATPNILVTATQMGLFYIDFPHTYANAYVLCCVIACVCVCLQVCVYGSHIINTICGLTFMVFLLLLPQSSFFVPCCNAEVSKRFTTHRHTFAQLTPKTAKPSFIKNQWRSKE